MERAGRGLSQALLQGGVGCAACQAVVVQPAGIAGYCHAMLAWQVVLTSSWTCVLQAEEFGCSQDRGDL